MNKTTLTLILTSIILLVGVAFPVGAEGVDGALSMPTLGVEGTDGNISMPTVTELAARPDIELISGQSLDGTTGCLPATNITGPGKNITGVDGKKHWAGVIRTVINGFETPVFCIDLYHNIYAKDCFYAAGPTSEALTWLLNNYTASFGLSATEAAARQAAVWFLADGWEIASPTDVRERALEILASIPDPMSFPLNPPTLELSPRNTVKVLPDGTVAYTVTAMQDGAPAVDLDIELTTTFGTLSADTVTTDGNGQARFTVTASEAGSAEVTARALFSLPRGTELWYAGTGRRQTLVLATPVRGYAYAQASHILWESDSTITAHKYADNNMNQVQDGSEPNLKDWTMTLYKDNDGTWKRVDGGKTNAAGNKTFSGLGAGTYKVVETMKSGWIASTAVEQIVQIGEGEAVTVDFGNIELAIVTARKFRDDNLNGIYDPYEGEPTLDGWRITLYKQVSGNWAYQANGYTRNGLYTFSSLEPGTYVVEETLTSGWVNSTVTSYQFQLGGGDNRSFDFGNIEDICSLQGPSIVAAGELATFVNRSGFVRYDWTVSGGTIEEDNGATIVWRAPATPGTYTIDSDAVTVGEAIQSCSLTVRVANRPVVSVNDAVFCEGDSGTLTATSDAATPSYLWSTGATTQSIVVTEAGEYTVIVTDGDTGLDSDASGQVTVYGLPTVSVDDATIYEGQTATLVVVTDATNPLYTWSTGETTKSIQVTAAGTYSVRVVEADTQCAAEAEATVTVLSVAPVVSVNDTVFCEGDSGTLSATSDATNPSYLWSTGETTQSIVVTEAGEYTVTVTDNRTGLSSDASGQVTVYGLPTVSVDDATIYEGQTATLVVVTDATNPLYTWSTGETTKSIQVTAAGTYSVRVVEADTQCAAEAEATVTVLSVAPVVSVNDTVFCEGDSGTLSATSDATNPSYLWSTGATTQSIVVTEAGEYTVTVTDNRTGLSSDASGTATVLPLPNASVVNATTFEGGPATLIVKTDAANPTFLWSTGDTTESIVVTEPGIYSVIVTDGVTECRVQAQGEVIVYGAPSAEVVVSDAAVCLPSSVTLTAATTAQQPSYLWSTGETTERIEVTEPGYYSVTVTDGLTGWVGSASGAMVGYPSPTADFASNDPVYPNETVSFTNLSSISDGSSLAYWWDFGDGSTSTEGNPTHAYAEPGTYQVTLVATREEGCEDQVTKSITIEPLPVFSVHGFVYVDGTRIGIPGSRVEFQVKVNGAWIPAGSMIVGDDGYFSFAYQGLVEAISLEEINAEGYWSTYSAPIPGGVAEHADLMTHEGLGAGEHGAYVFYDYATSMPSDCPCPEWVVFHSDRDGNWELYRMAPDAAAEPTNLTNHEATDLAPAISPRGDVAFQSDRDGNWEIYMVSEADATPVRLTDHPASDTDPVYSPVCETRRLAFQSDRDGHWEIYVSDAAPNSEWRLTFSDGDSTDPFWSPDGEWIVFQDNRDGNWNVYMINLGTREERQLTTSEGDDVNPQWSPDGDTIGFLSNRDGNWEIYAVSVASGAETRLTITDAEERNLAFSPNGDWLAYQSDRDGDWDLYVSRPDGSDLRVVAESPSIEEAPTWDCSSDRLVFHSDIDGNYELYIVDALIEGAAPLRLTDNPARDIDPTWQPAEEDASLWGLDLAVALSLELSF